MGSPRLFPFQPHGPSLMSSVLTPTASYIFVWFLWPSQEWGPWLAVAVLPVVLRAFWLLSAFHGARRTAPESGAEEEPICPLEMPLCTAAPELLWGALGKFILPGCISILSGKWTAGGDGRCPVPLAALRPPLQPLHGDRASVQKIQRELELHSLETFLKICFLLLRLYRNVMQRI